MADFVSGFWKWYILVLVTLSFVAILGLVLWMSKGRPRAGQKIETMGHVWDENLEELSNPLPMWWLYMFYITIVFGIAYLLIYPGSGVYAGAINWSEVGQYEKEMKDAQAKYGPLYDKFSKVDLKTLAANPEAKIVGQRLFATYCTSCHGSDAGGGPGFPNLRDGDWLYGGEPETIKASIANGRNGAMPPWGAMLGEEGVLNVTSYVMALSGRKVDENAALAGKEKFQQLCVSCHGADARGNKAMGAPNLTDNIWLYGGSQRAIMQSIREGRAGHMPAHGEFLGDAKVHLLAAYIYNIAHYQDSGKK